MVISAQSSDHTLTHPQRGAITHALIARKLGSHNNSTFRAMTISVIYGTIDRKKKIRLFGKKNPPVRKN